MAEPLGTLAQGGTLRSTSPSSLEVGIILVRDAVQVWAITALSQPLFLMTHSLWQWYRRVWSL